MAVTSSIYAASCLHKHSHAVRASTFYYRQYWAGTTLWKELGQQSVSNQGMTNQNLANQDNLITEPVLKKIHELTEREKLADELIRRPDTSDYEAAKEALLREEWYIREADLARQYGCGDYSHRQGHAD